jgi:hypothetical protein
MLKNRLSQHIVGGLDGSGVNRVIVPIAAQVLDFNRYFVERRFFRSTKPTPRNTAICASVIAPPASNPPTPA